MKRLAFMVMLLALLGLFSTGWGHPAKGIEMQFDAAQGLLTVTVSHDVKDAAKHYIKTIVVELNGRKIIEQDFSRQVDNQVQEAVYRIIDAAVGDQLQVIATCSIAGTKKQVLKVEKPPEPAGKKQETDGDGQS
jgi:hypothetical protein